LVFAQDHVAAAALPKNHTVEAAVRGNGGKWDFNIPRESFRWRQQVPIYPRATVLAADKLLVAGRPDRSVEDAITAMDGGAAGALFIFSASSGELLHQQELPASPAADGMIVAGGKVYISTDDNRLLCLDGPAD
jgi:outer membrane protein assembly factor BamB